MTIFLTNNFAIWNFYFFLNFFYVKFLSVIFPWCDILCVRYWMWYFWALFIEVDPDQKDQVRTKKTRQLKNWWFSSFSNGFRSRFCFCYISWVSLFLHATFFNIIKVRQYMIHWLIQFLNYPTIKLSACHSYKLQASVTMRGYKEMEQGESQWLVISHNCC